MTAIVLAHDQKYVPGHYFFRSDRTPRQNAPLHMTDRASVLIRTAIAYVVNLTQTGTRLNHGGIVKTGERASYQPKISDCTHAARLLSSHWSPFVSAQTEPLKPHE